MHRVHPFRVAVKAILLFMAANLAFACFNPSVGKLSIYNWLVRGRTRFPYNPVEADVPIVHAISVFENFDAMFASHVISKGSKPSDEYRVILLGDSSMWGYGLSPQDTLAEQINRRQLVTCNGRRVRAYDLGVPNPSALRDLLLMNQVQEYQPDLFVWFTVLDALADHSATSFAGSHPENFEAIVQRYHLNLDISGIKATSMWDRTIIEQRGTLHRIFMLQFLALPWAATGVDSFVSTAPAPFMYGPSDLAYGRFPSPRFRDDLLASLLFDTLLAGKQEANGARLLIVNEPIHVLSSYQGSVRYNQAFPRWAYDAYHQALGAYIRDRGLPYLDLWDFLPDSGFVVNSSLHRSPAGERMLAQRLGPEILQTACP